MSTPSDKIRAALARSRELSQAVPKEPVVEYAGEHGDKSAIVAGALNERYGNNALDFGEDHRLADFFVHSCTALPLRDDALEIAERGFQEISQPDQTELREAIASNDSARIIEVLTGMLNRGRDRAEKALAAIAAKLEEKP